MTEPTTDTGARHGALLQSTYWDQHWATTARADRYADLRWLRGNYAYVVLDDLLRRVLPVDPARSLIELGSGPGRWLVYFHRTFGYRVTGCDDSPVSCDIARATLGAAGVDGTILDRDFFALTGAYDVVFSAGVIEHFEDPAQPLAAFARLLRPGGLLVTSVPNLGGLNGLYHRALKPETFTTHRRITLGELRRWHGALGLQERLATAYGSLSLVRLPGDAFKRQPRLRRAWRPLHRVATALTSRACFLMHRFGMRVDHPVLSPHLLVVAQDPRPAQQ
jgi:2-polyprenyl-6-hydroxyphenyl methylase/3-demethylubiquinone-9 3-methyltransferase